MPCKEIQGQMARRGTGIERGTRMHGRRHRRPTLRTIDEIRATVIVHVVNQGLSVRITGLMVQPNLSLYTQLYYKNLSSNQQVRSTFSEDNRLNSIFL